MNQRRRESERVTRKKREMRFVVDVMVYSNLSYSDWRSIHSKNTFERHTKPFNDIVLKMMWFGFDYFGWAMTVCFTTRNATIIWAFGTWKNRNQRGALLLNRSKKNEKNTTSESTREAHNRCRCFRFDAFNFSIPLKFDHFRMLVAPTYNDRHFGISIFLVSFVWASHSKTLRFEDSSFAHLATLIVPQTEYIVYLPRAFFMLHSIILNV